MVDRRRRRGTLAGLGALLVGAIAIVILMTRPASPPAVPSVDPGPGGTDLPGLAPPIPPIDPVPWNGVSWVRLPVEGLQTRQGQGVRGLEQFAGGLLAHGYVDDPRRVIDPNNLDSVSAVWSSADGVTWETRPILGGVPKDSVSEVHAIAAGPRGIIAAGNVCCAVEAAAIWWSPDGAAWARSDVPIAAETWFTDAAAGPHGFVVTGMVGEQGAIWASPDGRTWTKVDPDGAGLARGAPASAVAVPDGFLAVGQVDPGIEDADAAIWRSVGLDDWQRIAADDPAFAGDDESTLSRIVPWAGGWFAIGGSGTRADREDCENLLGGVHLASLSDTALSCGWLREMTWHARDGGRWIRTDPWGADGTYPPDFVGPPPGVAPVSWDKVVAGGPGLVALQEEVPGPDGTGDNTIGVWTSADGATWSRVADGPRLNIEFPVGFAVDGRRLYVMTEIGHAWLGTALP